MKIEMIRSCIVVIVLVLMLLVTPTLVKATGTSGAPKPSTSLEYDTLSADTLFNLGKQFALGKGAELNPEKADELFEAAAKIDAKYKKLIENFYSDDLPNFERYMYWVIKRIDEEIKQENISKKLISCRNFRHEDTGEILRFAEYLAECRQYYLKQENVFLSPTELSPLIVNGYAKEVLKQLPMEFAVEAQKLLALTLEGSVG